MRRRFVIFFGVLLVFALVSVRFFQELLFYDPLIVFFKSAYTSQTALPPLDLLRLIVHTAIRFWLNASISIVLILLLFCSRENFNILLFIYGTVFVLLLIAYVLVIVWYEVELHLLLFYIRRFLIQPMMLLILIPAFYYHRLMSKA